MHILAEQLICKPFEIVYLGNGDKGKASQMGIHQHGLGIGVADYPDTGTSLKLGQFIFKFRTKIITLKTVNGTKELSLVTQRDHTATTRAEMRLIISSIEEVGNTFFMLVYCSKKAAHDCCFSCLVVLLFSCFVI